jgi:hypothetical protein
MKSGISPHRWEAYENMKGGIMVKSWVNIWEIYIMSTPD